MEALQDEDEWIEFNNCHNILHKMLENKVQDLSRVELIDNCWTKGFLAIIRGKIDNYIDSKIVVTKPKNSKLSLKKMKWLWCSVKILIVLFEILEIFVLISDDG